MLSSIRKLYIYLTRYLFELILIFNIITHKMVKYNMRVINNISFPICLLDVP